MDNEGDMTSGTPNTQQVVSPFNVCPPPLFKDVYTLYKGHNPLFDEKYKTKPPTSYNSIYIHNLQTFPTIVLGGGGGGVPIDPYILSTQILTIGTSKHVVSDAKLCCLKKDLAMSDVGQ